jgi:hypothetical protein
VRFDATTLWHFDAAERAPSTTPNCDTAAYTCHVRYCSVSDGIADSHSVAE